MTPMQQLVCSLIGAIFAAAVAFSPGAALAQGTVRQIKLTDKHVEGFVNAQKDMTAIAGQKPLVCKAKKSVSNFKLREGMDIGLKVTIRRERMYEFMDRLINLAIPRVKDFRGLNPKSFDGRGNYTLGIKEHIIFPEIDYDKASDIWGMDVTVCTSAKTDDEARALLTAFNFPFRQ